MTRDEKIALYTKVKANLDALEAAYPNDRHVRRNHHQWNTVALALEALDGEAVGTYGGAAGTVHPDSGGTDKGDAK